MPLQLLRPPRAVFFDAAGTLVYPHPSWEEVANAAVARVAPELVPLDTRALAAHIETSMVAHRQEGRLVHYPPAAAEQFWRACYRTFLTAQVPPDRAAIVADALFDVYTDLSTWALYPDVPGALAALRAAPLTLGLLSNWEDWLDDLLVALNVRTAFDHILISGKLGVEKPDPAIFKRALKHTGLAPDEIVYIGDSLHHDIEPCLALGIHAVLIDRGNRYPDDAGYARLTSLDDLPALLKLA